MHQMHQARYTGWAIGSRRSRNISWTSWTTQQATNLRRMLPIWRCVWVKATRNARNSGEPIAKRHTHTWRSLCSGILWRFCLHNSCSRPVDRTIATLHTSAYKDKRYFAVGHVNLRARTSNDSFFLLLSTVGRARILIVVLPKDILRCCLVILPLWWRNNCHRPIIRYIKLLCPRRPRILQIRSLPFVYTFNGNAWNRQFLCYDCMSRFYLVIVIKVLHEAIWNCIVSARQN